MSTKKSRIGLTIAFAIILVAIAAISIVGITLLDKKPVVLQGQIETTEIKISGKLTGRVEKLMVEEGEKVKAGDTLVIISCPEAEAKYTSLSELQNAARFQSEKIDDGTRKQIIETARQMWNKSKSDLELATITFKRTEALYKDSVLTSQRRDEVEAIYKAAVAFEKASKEQYDMAVQGARIQDKQSAKAIVGAAGGAVSEVSSMLRDSSLLAPCGGEISAIFPKPGELIGGGAPIMNLVVLDEAYCVLNVREDYMPNFTMGSKFKGDIPALTQKDVDFEIYFISPLGSYATWQSTKQSGSYDLRTFEIKARPLKTVTNLRPGMSVIITL